MGRLGGKGRWVGCEPVQYFGRMWRVEEREGEGEGFRMRGTGVLERLKNRLYRSSRTLITQK